MMATDPETGESVRGFRVLVFEAPHPRSAVLYPETGQPPFTGEQAMNLMREKKKLGIESQAHTEGTAICEALTLREMEEIYDLSIHPNI